MSRPCSCDRCGKLPWEPYQPGQCRLCWLYHHDAAYKDHWDGVETVDLEMPTRSLPCIYLGDVLDRKGCPCPGIWTRKCRLHGEVTISGNCKDCPDYLTEG